MKKVINRNFIISIILSLALLLVPLWMGTILRGIEEDRQKIQEKLELLEETEPGSTEELGMGAEVSGFGIAFFYLIVFIIAGYAFLLFLTALLAWLLYRKNPKRKLAYRVLMSVNYLLHVGVILVLADMLLEQFNIVVLLLTILVTSALLCSAFYTYSKRICAGSG